MDNLNLKLIRKIDEKARVDQLATDPLVLASFVEAIDSKKAVLFLPREDSSFFLSSDAYECSIIYDDVLRLVNVFFQILEKLVRNFETLNQVSYKKVFLESECAKICYDSLELRECLMIIENIELTKPWMVKEKTRREIVLCLCNFNDWDYYFKELAAAILFHETQIRKERRMNINLINKNKGETSQLNKYLNFFKEIKLASPKVVWDSLNFDNKQILDLESFEFFGSYLEKLFEIVSKLENKLLHKPL